MKRTISLLTIFLLVFISCEKNNQEVIETNNYDRPKNIGNLIDSAINMYPNFENNDIVEKELNTYLKKAFSDSLKNKEFLKDYKFKLLGTKEVGKGFTVNLLFNDTYGETKYNGKFNIIAVTNDESVKALINGEDYNVKVDFIGYYNDKRIYQLDHNGSLYTPIVGYFDGSIDFGVIVANLDTIY